MTPLADVRFETIDATILVAHVQGEIDMSNATELGSSISAHVSNEALAVVLDLGEVDYLDSAGIHAIFELRERLNRRGQEMRLVVAPDSAIAPALEYTDVPRTIGAAASVEDAIAQLRG